jgi:rhodanese-related sulfurtransferase
MRRRVFLACLMSVALSGACASAQSQGAQTTTPQSQATETPADRVTLEEFKALRAAGKVFVLDVRYNINQKIKGATHVPLGDLEAHLAELPRDREIVTYCSWPEEHTSARAAQILRDKGFKARALLGGWNAWVSSGGETEAVEGPAAAPAQNVNAQQPSTQRQPAPQQPPPPSSAVDDSKTPAVAAPKKTDSANAQPARATTQTTAKPKSRTKHKRTKPHTD